MHTDLRLQHVKGSAERGLLIASDGARDRLHSADGFLD
jgi:hypothetical protein